MDDVSSEMFLQHDEALMLLTTAIDTALLLLNTVTIVETYQAKVYHAAGSWSPKYNIQPMK